MVRIGVLQGCQRWKLPSSKPCKRLAIGYWANGSKRKRINFQRMSIVVSVAGAAVFLASAAAAYVTGHILVVDGGWLAAGGGLKG